MSTHGRRPPAGTGTGLGWVALAVVVGLFVGWIVRELAAADNAMSAHGWVALTIGIVGTCGVAGVLMWLLFRSAHHDEGHR